MMINTETSIIIVKSGKIGYFNYIFPTSNREPKYIPKQHCQYIVSTYGMCSKHLCSNFCETQLHHTASQLTTQKQYHNTTSQHHHTTTPQHKQPSISHLQYTNMIDTPIKWRLVDICLLLGGIYQHYLDQLVVGCSIRV